MRRKWSCSTSALKSEEAGGPNGSALRLLSPHVVQYYGSYFKNSDLLIVMEYCGAGSVADIIRIRNKTVRCPRARARWTAAFSLMCLVLQLTEDEIATILQSTLKGLEYLHFMRKIHRDIKAGNILLNSEGQAKLADFGVAGQLTVSEPAAGLLRIQHRRCAGA